MKPAFIRAAAAGLAALALSASVFAAGTWRIATEPTFPPFEFVNSQTGELLGFEMDIVRAMAKAAGKDLEIETMRFDGILPALISGTVDAGAAGFSMNPERAKRVLFVNPFYRCGLGFLVKNEDADKMKTFADLKGKRISVQLGSVAATAAFKIEGAKVTTFDSAGDAILNMMAGNADAVINDHTVTSYILTQNANFAKSCTHQTGELLSTSVIAMVVSKKNPKMLGEMNAALQKIVDDGTYNELHKKRFGTEAPALIESPVNK